MFCRNTTRASARFRFPFRGSCGNLIGLHLVQAHPARPLPFPAGPIGFSLAAVAVRFNAGGSPLCGLPFSSKLSNHPSTASGSAIPNAPLLEFRPLQRSTIPGAR
jgi:hypothetical protein